MYGHSNLNFRSQAQVFGSSSYCLGFKCRGSPARSRCLDDCIGTWSIKFVVLLSVFFLAKKKSLVFLNSKSSFEDYLRAGLPLRWRLSKLNFPIQMLHQRNFRV